MKMKLSDADRAAIRDMYKADESVRSIARQFGVSRGTVRFIIDPEAAEKNLIANRERQRNKRKLNKMENK